MKPVRFFGKVLLSIFLLIGMSISADILSENFIERNGQTVLQLMVSVDSGSMSPNLVFRFQNNIATFNTLYCNLISCHLLVSASP